LCWYLSQTLNGVTSDITDAETTHATNDMNKLKNRYQDSIPCKPVGFEFASSPEEPIA
jgi:hypothetical protein